MSKQLFNDSDSSHSEERDALGEGNLNDPKSTVRYPEDSDIDYNLKRKRKRRYKEDDDYVAYINVDPNTQKENGFVKRRSAQEAARKCKKYFDESSDDEEVVLGEME